MYEIACRAGATNVYWWGNEPDASHIWCKENAGAGTDMGGSKGSTVAVGLKSPNAWGLYDMAGNVCQWCLDDSNVSGPVGYMTSRPDAFTPYCGEFPRSVTADDANKPKRRSRCKGFWDTTYTHDYFWLSNRGSDNAHDAWANNKGFRVAFIVK